MIFEFLKHNLNSKAFYLGDDKYLTYGDFQRLLAAYIGYLKTTELRKGDRVFLFLPQDITLILSYYACLYLGLIAVPVFAETTPEEIAKIQVLTGGKYVLTTLEISQTLRADVDISGQFILINCSDIPTESTAASPLVDPDWPEETDAMLFLTSGSTGLPKAVTYTYKTLNSADKIYRETLELSEEDRLITTLDMNGNAGFVLQILPLLNAGSSIQLLPERTGESVYRAIQEGATVMCMIPWLGMELLDYAAASRPLLENQLKYCIVGGDRIPERLFSGFPEVFNVCPNQVIGMSETNVYAMNLTNQRDKPRSAGKIVPETQVKIVSSTGEVQVAGKMGEILVKTPMIFDCYWGAPEITRKVVTEDGWVKTGDLGYFDENNCLFFAGRIKQIIINCGDNIYPQEVEAACMQHPNVKSAIVVGIPNPAVGEEIGVVFTLNDPAQSFEPSDLQGFLDGKLSESKCPTQMRILDKLPESKAGKVDRSALREFFTESSGPLS